MGKEEPVVPHVVIAPRPEKGKSVAYAKQIGYNTGQSPLQRISRKGKKQLERRGGR